MDICNTRPVFSFNFVEQCLNNTNNTNNKWLNGSEVFEKDVGKYIHNNGFMLGVGFLIAFLLETEIIKKQFQAASKIIFSNEVKISILTKLLSLLCLLFSLIISPIILIIFSICSAYRTAVHFVLKHKFEGKYVRLLDGTDVVWAIEDVSKSVINILAIIDIENIEEFKNKLTEKMTKIVEDPKFAKLKYCREKCYGYYFWGQNEFSNNINYLKTVGSSEEGLNKEELLQLISEYSNKILPNNHTASWEILIGQQKLKTDNENETNYPVLFRFHHSIGDGIALLKILLEASDSKTNEENQININGNDKTLTTLLKFKLLSFFQTILSIVFVPGHMIQMNLMKSIDNNVLHGNVLSGEKTLAWISENDDFPILKTIKYIKSKFEDVSFLDVVLMALSEAFYGYFEQKTNEIPPSVTAVILERVDKIRMAEYTSDNSSCELQNRFSVGMVNLPILPLSPSSPEPGTSPGSSAGLGVDDSGIGSDLTAIERLQEVNRETMLLKNASPDYQINYWLLKVVSKLLPEPILRPMLHSAHSTMVVSNILGPQEVTICSGHLIKNLIFWLPHRGLTGIGVSVLSYAGKLRIGITADKALIENPEEAELILLNFVRSLKLFSETLKDKSTHKMVQYLKLNLQYKIETSVNY